MRQSEPDMCGERKEASEGRLVGEVRGQSCRTMETVFRILVFLLQLRWEATRGL